jgi:glycerophosphoryl diester phosphodiesterase
MKTAIFSALIFAAAGAQAAGLKAPLVHGHRGTRGLRPENTLPAFSEALRAGADFLELDMDVTKDNVVVVSHEPKVTPERCLAPDGKRLEKAIPIHTLTFEELRKYDCGSLPNPKFPRQVLVPGTPMPSLDEVFSLVENSTYPAAATEGFNIETKIFPSQPQLNPAPAEFAKLVMDVVRKHHMEKRVIVQSFDVRTLREIKKLAPSVRTSQLTDDNLLAIVPALKADGTDIWSPNGAWVTPASVKEAQAAGIQVAPWTLDTQKEWDLAIAAGVDAIITDYPGDLIDYLKAKKLRQ